MSNLQAFSLQEDLSAAIRNSLPSGEFAIHHALTFTAEARWYESTQSWGHFIQGWSYMTLTNVAFRFHQFQLGQRLTAEQEAKKVKLMAEGMSEAKATKKAIGWGGSPAIVVLPEIVFSSSLPLSDISAISYHEGDAGIGYATIGAGLKQAGYNTRAVGVLQFHCRGEQQVVYSPFSALAEIYRQSDAIKSGRAVAASIITTEASLTRLKSLLDENIISTEEFEKAKSGLVGKAADLTESVASTLRQLNSLFLSGVLTEAEFRAKKFDVLANG